MLPKITQSSVLALGIVLQSVFGFGFHDYGFLSSQTSAEKSPAVYTSKAETNIPVWRRLNFWRKRRSNNRVQNVMEPSSSFGEITNSLTKFVKTPKGSDKQTLENLLQDIENLKDRTHIKGSITNTDKNYFSSGVSPDGQRDIYNTKWERNIKNYGDTTVNTKEGEREFNTLLTAFNIPKLSKHASPNLVTNTIDIMRSDLDGYRNLEDVSQSDSRQSSPDDNWQMSKLEDIPNQQLDDPLKKFDSFDPETLMNSIQTIPSNSFQSGSEYAKPVYGDVWQNPASQEQKGEFDSDSSGCVGIEIKSCSSQEDCSCYGLYHCSAEEQKCMMWSSPQLQPQQDHIGIWSDKPIPIV